MNKTDSKNKKNNEIGLAQSKGITLDELLEKLILKDKKEYRQDDGEMVPYEYLSDERKKQIIQGKYDSFALRMRLVFPNFPTNRIGIQRQIGGNDERPSDGYITNGYRLARQNQKIINEARAIISATYWLIIKVYMDKYRKVSPRIKALDDCLNEVLSSGNSNVESLKKNSESACILFNQFRGDQLNKEIYDNYVESGIYKTKSEFKDLKDFKVVLCEYYKKFKILNDNFEKTIAVFDSVTSVNPEYIKYKNIITLMYWMIVECIFKIHQNMKSIVGGFNKIIAINCENLPIERIKQKSREVKKLSINAANNNYFTHYYNYFLNGDDIAYAYPPEFEQRHTTFLKGLVCNDKNLQRLSDNYEMLNYSFIALKNNQEFRIINFPSQKKQIFEKFTKCEEEIVYTIYEGLSKCNYSSETKLVHHLQKGDLSIIP